MTFFHLHYCDYNRSNVDYDKIDRPEGSGDYLLLHFLTPMKVYLNQETIVTKPGAFLLFSPGMPQQYQAVKAFTNNYIHFHISGQDFCDKYRVPVNTVFYPPHPEIFQDLFQRINAEVLEKQLFCQEQINLLIHQLFLLLSRQLHQTQALSPEDMDLLDLFRKARLEILAHLEKDWTAEKMAALTNLSVSQFYHYYQMFFHKPPKAELISARLDRAKYLLKQENLPVSRAAGLSGFRSLPHFTRLFEKNCGLSPSAYRQQTTDISKVSF